MIIHQCISGFTQDVNTFHGILRLSEKIRGAVDCKNNRFEVHRWCSNWKAIAEYYALLASYYEEKLTVCIYAYSWGAGWGAMELSRQLSKRGIEIRVMVLSDPVFRHPKWYLRWVSLLLRDTTLLPIIRVPHNVEEVYTFHQKMNRPQGHRLLPSNGTMIYPSKLVKNCNHQNMDDAFEFHSFSVDVARKISHGVVCLK